MAVQLAVLPSVGKVPDFAKVHSWEARLGESNASLRARDKTAPVDIDSVKHMAVLVAGIRSDMKGLVFNLASLQRTWRG